MLGLLHLHKMKFLYSFKCRSLRESNKAEIRIPKFSICLLKQLSVWSPSESNLSQKFTVVFPKLFPRNY